MKKYVYFVSYSHPSGFGQIEIFRDKKISNYKDILEVREVIKKSNGFENIIIINYIELENNKEE